MKKTKLPKTPQTFEPRPQFDIKKYLQQVKEKELEARWNMAFGAKKKPKK